jgi:hypothetical protein
MYHIEVYENFCQQMIQKIVTKVQGLKCFCPLSMDELTESNDEYTLNVNLIVLAAGLC